MQELCALLDVEVASEILFLFLEYENAATPGSILHDISSSDGRIEALFVKDLDKFEMILQAYEYEQGLHHRLILLSCAAEHRPGHLQPFFDSTQGDNNCMHLCLTWRENTTRDRAEAGA